MRRLLFLLLFIPQLVCAQVGEIFYVHSSSLNLRSEPNTKSEVVEKLQQYDNLEILELKDDWIKVLHGENIGFVYSDYIQRGKAVVSIYTVRTGAKCKDGSNSSATGRGACSHHGGVSYWKTKDKKSVRIEN